MTREITYVQEYAVI